MPHRFSTHRTSRRSIASAGAAIGGLSLLGGRNVFAQSTPGASPAAAPAEAPVSKVAERASGEVRLTDGSDQVTQGIVEAMLEGFAAKYPNITVKYEAIPADYLTKIQTDIAAGTVADVFAVQNEYAQDFMSRDVLTPIDDYMAEDGITADMYYPALVDAYSWQDKMYGLPKDWSPIGAVYDPDAFSSAGVQAPTTWDELRATLQTLKDSTGTPALALNAQFSRFVMFLYQAGGNITDKDVTKITLDSPETTQALEFYYGLYKDGLSATSADIGAGWPGDAFVQGLTSMVYEGNWMFPTLANDAPDKKFAVAELPQGPAGPGTPAFTQAFSIFNGTKNPDAAWVLVNYLTSVDGVREMLPFGLAMPPLPSLESEYLSYWPEREPYLKSGAYATSVQYGPGGMTFESDANSILESLFAGQIDVPAAQQQMFDAATKNIKLVQ